MLFPWDGMEVKANACNLTAETNMEHESERNPVEKIRKMQVANRRSASGKLEEGRKAALQPHPVHFCEFGQWESARSRVEHANSVRSCPLSMKIFATIGHWRKIPRVQTLRSPNSQPCELGNLTIEIPKVDSWRPRCLANMLAARSQAFFRADEDEFVRLTSLIDSLVTN